MATSNYFDRMMPRRGLGGFYSPPILSDDRGAYSLPSRKFRQTYLQDARFFTGKTFSSSSSSIHTHSSLQPTVTRDLFSGQVREHSGSVTRPPSHTEMHAPHHQSSLDLVASSLKCDDCQTNDGLFQCCHCNQRLCIQCCNKHYKSITVELERLHELSDRLVAKILHTKNDLERQKNDTLEQCHKWRVDTINTINKAHALIVQTIHNEYDTLGKEYELYVQKEMARIHVDQNELMRIKKSNLDTLLSSPSSSATDSTNPIDTIRKRIETFAKNIDETGKFSFLVKLPTFDIDDRLRVESRFGDITRSTSATWQNANAIPFSLPTDRSTQNNKPSNNFQSSETYIPSSLPTQDSASLNNVQSTDTDIPSSLPTQDSASLNNVQSIDTCLPSSLSTQDNVSLNYVQSTETDIPLSNNGNDVLINTIDKTEEVPNKIDVQELNVESRTATSSPLPPCLPEFERNSTSFPSTRYALSVENNVELQQQQFYSPTFRGDCYDSAYGTAPSSPNNPNDHQSSILSLQEQSTKNFSYPSNNESSSFHNNHQHTHAFQQTSSPAFHHADNEDSFRSVSYVQLKREEDGSIEGVAIQIEQSNQIDGKLQRRRTCMESCGVRRQTTILPPRSPSSSNTDMSSNDQPGLYYRTNSTPTVLH